MVKQATGLLALLILTAPLAGCFEEKVYTVEEFKADPALMKKVNAECNNNPGEARNRPNCWNAGEARSKLEIEAAHAAFSKGIK